MDLRKVTRRVMVMQIQFQGFHPYSVNNGSGWNMAAMQKKRQLLAEESAQKEQEALKTSISAEARSIWDQLENAEQSETDYTKQLLQVEDTLNEISHNLARTETKATLEEKLKALAELRKLQETKDTDAKKKAQDLAEKNAKQQDEINQNNSELLMVLECIEKLEEDEEAKTNECKPDEESEEKETQNHADMDKEISEIGVSAIKKDLHMNDTIDAISKSGDEKLAKANEMMHTIRSELENVYRIIEDEQCSLEEKEEAATKFVSMARSSYSDLRELRATGLQQKQNAREIKLKYIGSQHLIEAQKAQEEMQAIATTSVIRQNLQEIVDKYGEQLKDKVKEKIDERNDIISNEKQEETILDELSLLEKEEEQEEKNDITK